MYRKHLLRISIIIPVFVGVICLFLFFKNGNMWYIQNVKVTGEYSHTDTEKIRRVAESYILHKNLFTLKLDAMKKDLVKLPWINSVTISRFWPSTLEIYVIEETPVAIWNDRSIFNIKGVLFTPESFEKLKPYPVLYGPSHLSDEVFKQYKDMSEQMLSQTGKIKQFTIDERSSVTLTLDNGLKLILGRDDPSKKLKRFVEYYNDIIGINSQYADTIDLRYKNGLAVNWKK